MNHAPTLKAAIASTIFLLSSFTTTEVFAARANWNLKFYNSSGKTVGFGHFAYDPTTVAEIATDLGSNTITVQNQLTSFEGTISDLGYSTSWEYAYPFSYWWADENRPQGNQLDHRYGIFINYDQWFLGDTYSGSGVMLDRFSQLDEYLWTGNWSWNDDRIDIGGGKPLGLSGSFSAEYKNYQANSAPVPLPAGLPLFASAVGVLGFLNRRRKQSNHG